MPELLNDHDIVVGRFALGSLGLNELEAMSCGRPIVMEDRYPDAYPEPGPVARAGSGAEACDAIAGLIDDEAERVRLGAAARAWVARHHERRIVVDRLIALYARIEGG